jgi:hypothetical protein
MAAEIRMRNGNGRSGDVTCSSVAAVEILVHSKPWLLKAQCNIFIAESDDSKSKKFLFERSSLAIQRGNAASIRGTFPDSAILSEIFVLNIKQKCYVIMLLIF